MNTVELKLPYLVFLGDIDDATLAKTGAGLVQWCKDDIVGQLRLPGCAVDLGVSDMSISQAVTAGARSLVIGVATIGGGVKPHWVPLLEQALQAGLDIVNGLHTDLNTINELDAAQHGSAGTVINVRQSPKSLPVGTHRRRSGKRVLTVGTDCAVGKKYTALALTRTLQANGADASFRATGQTGIMIAGEGIPIDSVVSDFLSGAVELISPDNDPGHWDVIEGQGSLFNPSFSGVSMGLLHGAQPDALVICHDAARHQVSTCPGMALPSLSDCIDLHLRCARIVNPDVVCIGISVNTSSLSPESRQAYLDRITDETGLPCVDPLVDGCQLLVDRLLQRQAH